MGELSNPDEGSSRKEEKAEEGKMGTNEGGLGKKQSG